MSNNEIKWKDVLQMFCDDPETSLRTWMTKPFMEMERRMVWATDGHALLMVSPKLCGADFPVISRPLEMPAETAESEWLSFTIGQLRHALSRCPMQDALKVDVETEVCQECGGSGMVEWEYYASNDNEWHYAEYPCPACEGDGEIECERRHKTGEKELLDDAAISIDSIPYRAHEIQRIADAMDMLGSSVLEIISIPHPARLVLFRLAPDVKLALMPVISSDHIVTIEC